MNVEVRKAKKDLIERIIESLSVIEKLSAQPSNKAFVLLLIKQCKSLWQDELDNLLNENA